jgi:hypothetical protein
MKIVRLTAIVNLFSLSCHYFVAFSMISQLQFEFNSVQEREFLSSNFTITTSI